ncbi:hypothetical protein SGRA_3499 [Saprospira grandis str. Lewin]|uniref:Uncharacterized protein n=1 Tax=Saprospira grandis (strain Lewin) TaxID=984262 RepID=H6L059_SAPGL|nr:hypothetical protein SGRA_3499 [Saprospira grandis str. Lewin]
MGFLDLIYTLENPYFGLVQPHRPSLLVPQLFLGGFEKGEVKKGSFSGWVVLRPWAKAHGCRLSKERAKALLCYK